jgi:hypothetical protein
MTLITAIQRANKEAVVERRPDPIKLFVSFPSTPSSFHFPKVSIGVELKLNF